ncbi:MAG: putative pterin-4-alpha-carbinolamine dehydratase [Gammaproteobacteria bacterium]|jgi:4a-hydroxytetrahydrobiopterin dehydratase|nr:putative pterin-4-alpha-carbinolamine dehydratase [Gammaproteobacteria bacterium]
MNTSCSLSDKKCIPCEGETPALAQREADRLLSELQGQWSVNEAGHLYKPYKFPNFMAAMEFANKIAILAEQEAHHPDLMVAWGKCAVEIWTHKINGLTESDFILAAKIEKIKSA